MCEKLTNSAMGFARQHTAPLAFVLLHISRLRNVAEHQYSVLYNPFTFLCARVFICLFNCLPFSLHTQYLLVGISRAANW